MQKQRKLRADVAFMVLAACLTAGLATRANAAGLATQDLSAGLVPADLVNALLGSGVAVSNVTYTGANGAAGLFTGGTGIIGFENGIILSSGNIANVVGPNTQTGVSSQNGTAGDADLSATTSDATNDAAVLEFDFVPTNNVITFSYVFASDEYNECDYHDVFAFFVNGVNQALLPGTTTAVSILNVNNGANPAYYIDNDNQSGGAPLNTEMDGMTVVLTVTAPVNPGAVNHIKLAIADAVDNYVDSVVFIAAGSFTSSNISLTPPSASNLVGTSHTVTATVLADDDQPVPGVTVDFSVVAGPHTGASGSAVTLADGTATWSYTGTTAGMDTIQATALVGEVLETSNNAYQTWVAAVNHAPAIDLDADDSGGTGGADYAKTFTVGGAAVALSDVADATVTDSDNTTMASLTITGAGIADGADEIVTIGGVAYPQNADKTATATKGATTFQIAFVVETQVFTITQDGGGEMPIDDLNSLLRDMTYQNTTGQPTAGNRTFTCKVNDGDADSNNAVSTISFAGLVTGTLVINDGAETTVSRSVTLTLDAVSTVDSMYEMCFSYDGTTWTGWEAYATSRPFVLTPGNGLRTVWVRYADAQWNESLPISTTITLAEPPVVLPIPRQIKAVAAIELYPGAKTELTLLDYVDDPAYERVLVKTSLGDIPLRLFTAQTPLTVANFLRYVDAKLYDNTFFHRSIPGFIVQGGGHSIDSTGTVQDVLSYGPVNNEFGVSSTRATIAMAKVGNDPDSATCEWFFNLADNSANLDYQNGGFTVFGEVLDMTAVDAIAALPTANVGDPFANLPLKKYDGVNIYLADLIYLTSAARQPDELTFTVTGSVPGLNASVTSDGRLVIEPGADQVLTGGTFTLHASTPDGRVLDLPIPVSVVPPPPPPPGAAPAITALTFNRLAKGTPGTLRVYLDVVGTNTPTQWSATGGVAPTGWIDVTGYTTDPATPTRLSFPVPVQIPATAGARALAVTLKNANGLSSAAKSVSVTVPAMTVSAASVRSVSGVTATLSVTATSTADEYAVMDSVWDAASAVWLPIAGGTVSSGSVTFSPSCALKPLAGAHTVNIAVRRTDLGIVSAAKSATTTLAGPAVYSLKAGTVSGTATTLAVTVTGGPTEYAVMEGVWNTAAAVWKTIPPGTIASGRLTFSANFTVAPSVGKHTLYAALRDPGLGLTSAAKSVTATVTGPAIYSLKAGTVNGTTTTLAVTVTGNPTEYCIMEGTWNLTTAVWKTIPPGTTASGRLTFAADGALTPTAGGHTLYVAARDPVTTLTSATKTVTVTLAAPGMYALSSKGVAGTVVTLSITVTGGPDQFAVMESAWNAGAAVWKTIPLGTITSGRLIFAADFALTPTAGAHTVYVAAHNALLNATSAPKSVSVSVAAPTITSMTPASGDAGRDVVTLTGTAFGPSPGASGKVEFGGVLATIQSWTNTQIKCVVPQAAPLGAANVIVTTAAGLVSAPRVFTVLPFWFGAWTGTFQDTADSEAGGGPLKHGWTLLTAATTATTNGISLRLATGETLTGTLNPADGTFTTAGARTDGTALTFSGTLLSGSLTETLTWLEPGGASGTSDYALTFPSTAKATLSGTYVGPTEDQFDSRGLPLIAKTLLLTASQSGQTVTLTDAVFGTKMTGTLAGDVFVAVGTGMTVYGHVTATDATGVIQAFEATYGWADSAAWGWGELDAGRSSGVVGVSTGTTTWDLTAASSSGGTVPLSTTIAVNSFGNKITLTATDPALVKHTMVGKIYRNADGLASTFVAKDTVQTFYGVLNATAVTGSYENETPGNFDNGTYTGVKH